VNRRAFAAALLSVLAAACGGGEQTPPAAAPAAQPAPPAADVPEELRGAVRDAPEDDLARRRLAIALHEVGRIEEALAEFEQLVARSPNRRHLLDLALAYGGAGRDAEAEATYGRLLALAPEDPVALHNLGNIALRRGDEQGAIEYYTRAVAARPDYLIAHYHLGQALQQEQRFAEAYRSFERVLEVEPHDGEDLVAADDALYRMATIDLRMGALERAAAYLAQVLEADPGHPRAHHDYGEALMRLGRREEAAAQLDLHMRLEAERGGPPRD
jgi:tetratricopeptide (TPR) repeat protein